MLKDLLAYKSKSNLALYIMLIPAIVIIIIFSYVPMFGIVIAFENYNPAFGIANSKWVGLQNFISLANMPETFGVLRNTIFISVMEIVLRLAFPVLVALLLNEVTKKWFRRSIQTMIYLPHFLSWIILGGIILDVFSLKGILNGVLNVFGIQSIMFLGDNKYFPYVLIFTNLWKSFGFSTIVFLASITNINPTLYEAAESDGANRLQQAFHVTIPGMMPIIVLVATLSLGDVLNAGFEQVFTLYNPAVYSSGDIIDTFVYRLGMIDGRYSIATAVGLFKSLVSMILISASYFIAYKTVDYRIF